MMKDLPLWQIDDNFFESFCKKIQCKDLTVCWILKIQLPVQSMHKKVTKGTKRMPRHMLPKKDV